MRETDVGPCNWGKKRGWDGPAVTWKEPKKSCGHKDEARQARSCPHVLSLFPALISLHLRHHAVPALPLFSRATSSPPSLPRPLFSGGALRGFHGVYHCAGSVPGGQRQGSWTGSDGLAGAQVSVARGRVSWQSSWKLNTLDVEIKGLAVIWLVQSLPNIMSPSDEGKKDRIKIDCGVWDVVSCCFCAFLKRVGFFFPFFWGPSAITMPNDRGDWIPLSFPVWKCHDGRTSYHREANITADCWVTELSLHLYKTWAVCCPVLLKIPCRSLL